MVAITAPEGEVPVASPHRNVAGGGKLPRGMSTVPGSIYPDVKVDRKVYPSGIPDTLPDHVTLTEVVKSMPKEVFQKNMWKAWQSVIVTVISVALSFPLLYYSPWYVLPVSWFIAGTAWTGLFVIGHDCGHLSFSRSKLVNDVVGTLVFLPLFFPFEPWRIRHNFHHSHTNKLEVDNAWQPFQKSWYTEAGPTERVVMRLVKTQLYWIASAGHWINFHFFPSTFGPEHKARTTFSVALVLAFAAVAFPLVSWNVGVWGLFKFWLVPLVGFHFWMSTFTLVHHTLPHIPFLPAQKWSDARARLTLTVHCEYPKWIEFLCHHINVHVPHHVSTGIPQYNLRMAHNALKARWGKYMHEVTFGLPLIRDITTQCHIYNEEKCYVDFATADSDKDGKAAPRDSEGRGSNTTKALAG
jgi:omega-6 fatty acid desaturase (delta-12 desaturase)